MTQVRIPGGIVRNVPERAITVLTPWAWAMLSAQDGQRKDIENRSPGSGTPRDFRGPLWIHTAGHCTVREYDEAARICRVRGLELPSWDWVRQEAASTLQLGSIVGWVDVTGCLSPGDHCVAPWHFPGKFGFQIPNYGPVDTPVACKGQLGFWRPDKTTLAALAGQASVARDSRFVSWQVFPNK